MKKIWIIVLFVLLSAVPAWATAYSGDDQARAVFDSVNKRYLRVYRNVSASGLSQSIRAMVFNADGSVYSDTPIRIAAVACSYPAVAFDAKTQQYLVVWSENDGGNVDIYGQLVDANGDATGGLIQFSSDAGDQVQPSVACDSTGSVGNFFVVWTDNGSGSGNISGKFMSANGVPDASVTVVCNNPSTQSWPDVAFSPALGKFLVVWDDKRSGFSDVRGIFFANKLSLDNEFQVNTSDFVDQISPRVACPNSGQLLLVCYNDGASNGVIGQMVNGTLASATGTQIIINSGSCTGSTPSLSLAYGLDRYLVTWVDSRNPATGNDIYGQYLTAAGQTIDANFAVNTGNYNQANPYVAANSADGSFLAGWGYPNSDSTIWHLGSTILNAPVTPTPGGGSSGGGGGGCFIESIGGGWQMLAGLLSGLLLIAGVRRR